MVPSPEKVPNIYANRLDYLENSPISANRLVQSQNERYSANPVRESEELFENNDASPIQRIPILYVDVNLGDDRVERLTVFEGKVYPNSILFGI